MDKLQINVSVADKKFVDSLIPDRGFKTWAVANFFMAIVRDIKNAGIDCYSEENEQSIRRIVRERTAELPVGKVSQSDDSGRSKRVRKAPKAAKKKSARSKPAVGQRAARGPAESQDAEGE